MIDSNKSRLVFIFFMAVLAATKASHAQDGSNILYGSVDQLDKTYLGDFIHIDFYRRSFRGKMVDTVSIKIGGRQIKFLEHRQDNGYNNWFEEQFLIAVGINDDLSMRIPKSKLIKVTADSIYVTNYIEFYNKDGRLVSNREEEDKYSKKIIAEILVSEKSHVK